MNLSGKPGERSDLYATVDVELPRQLTPEERTHFEELAKSNGASTARRNARIKADEHRM